MPEAREAGIIDSRDPALLAAWRRFLDYDSVSSQQKMDFSRLREWVITLGLFTSALAVFSTYVTYVLPGYMPETLALRLQDGFRIALFIMPIITVGLLSYAAQFASSTTWIEYRVGAETIRSEIYLYRLKAGIYKGLDTYAARARLLEVIAAANARIAEQGATLPYMQKHENVEALIAKKTDSPGKDKGLNALTINEYIQWRVQPQFSWYVSKIQRDYAKLRRERIMALTVAGAVPCFRTLAKIWKQWWQSQWQWALH